jgi:hypothetical protein
MAVPRDLGVPTNAPAVKPLLWSPLSHVVLPASPLNNLIVCLGEQYTDRCAFNIFDLGSDWCAVAV